MRHGTGVVAVLSRPGLITAFRSSVSERPFISTYSLDTFLIAQVARNERRLWDRNSALSVPGKTFSRTAQLAKEALYDQQRRPEAPRSAARPSHRVSALRLAQNLGTAAHGCNFAGFAMNDALIQRCLTDIAISVAS